MSSQIEFVPVTKDLYPILGEPVKGTRTYRRKGTQEEVGHWYDLLSKTIGPTVSPGGVRMFVPVTRAAIHERMNRGRLSVFEFDVTTRQTNLFGAAKTVQERPYAYVPVSECRQWRAEIEERAKARGFKPEDIDRAKPGWLDDFLEEEEDKDNTVKKSRPTTLEFPISEYDLERLTGLAEKMEYKSPGELVAAFLKPVFEGGFSGLSFAKAGWWMSGQMEKYKASKIAVPNFIKKMGRKK